MMHMSETLYEELISVRDGLRDAWKTRTGKARRICDDAAIEEMVRLMPRKPTDFSLIDGVGKAFIESYAPEFLKVIDSRRDTDRGLDGVIECRLQELEKKLVNISRGNRLLFMPRASNAKEYFDLAHLSHLIDPMDILFKRGERIRLASPDARTADGRPSDAYRRISQLHRNVTKILREKGQNDLYVGYPFVEGCLPGAEFYIKAPLVLFPVELIRTPEYIDIRFDDSRDIVFNSTLILGYYKIAGMTQPLPDDILDDAEPSTFVDSVLGYYREAGLEISGGSVSLEPFTDYRNGHFPQYPEGTLLLRCNMILGRFPTYSNSIQKDFDDIVTAGMSNPLLTDLLSHGGEPAGLPDGTLDENGLFYINDLNSSQEKALGAIRSTDRLVIQGPPGTGKSQTITSMIADYVSQGKSVLMVSEKKAALDVVHSRLGPLSGYCMLIDDVNNKGMFFDQMEAMTRVDVDTSIPNDPSRISESIQSRFGLLHRIAETVYTPSVLGMEPYLLYTTLERPDPSDRKASKRYNAVADTMPRHILDCGCTDLLTAHERFKRRSLLTDISDCMQMRSQHPWLADLRPELNDYEAELATYDLGDLKKEIESWKNGGFFSKMMNKTKMKERVEEVMSRYWTFYRCIDPAYTYGELDEYIHAFASYDEYSSVNSMYESLSDCGKMYADMMLKMVDNDLCSPNLANEEAFSFLSLQHLFRFDRNSGEILRDMDSFSSITGEIGSLMKEKERCCIDTARSVLAHSLSEITASKRYPEMRRVLDMKRKWNVGKFIGRFDYELFRGIRVWLLTPEVVSEILPLEPGLFDLVIFDEASQMFLERGIPSVMRAKKVVIAGDHQQLHPSKLGSGRIGLDEDDAEAEGIVQETCASASLLDTARARYPSLMLNYHYRSRYSDLIEFSNHAFYGGRLFVSPDLEPDHAPAIRVHRIRNGYWKDRCNRPEAERVVDLLSDILRTKDDETVGIITFNSSQMDLIDSLIEERCSSDPEFSALCRKELGRKENGEDVGLFVKNIENVQGDERDIIIFSVGYAKGDNGKLVRNFGWLNQSGGENRLNVAISRARTGIHVVTSFDPSELIVDDMKNRGPKLLKLYLEYCFAVSSDDRQTANGILRSLHRGTDDTKVAADRTFADRVFRKLTSKGLDVVRDVGIGGYTIDMAVRKNGRFVLGIECDGTLYHSGMDDRERDWHMQRYLESRGWNIVRAWSPKWWKDADAEADRIVSIVNGTDAQIPNVTISATETAMCSTAKT